MKIIQKNAFFYRALAFSFLLHGAFLFASYRTIDFSQQPEYINISLRTKDLLPRVTTPSEKTQINNSQVKSDTSSGTVSASPHAFSLDDKEHTMLRYTDIIRQRIQEAIIYPHQARKDGIEGRPYVRFSINSNGEVTSVELVRSSGYSLLDEEALSAIRRASPFPKIPESLNRQSITYIQGLAFVLK